MTIESLYKRKETDLGDGRTLVEVVVDAKQTDQIGKIVQRERSRARMPELSQSDLQTEIDRILENHQRTIQNPEVHYELNIDVVEYQRGLVKIAYELAWYWLGDKFLDDPESAKLRAAIQSSGDLESFGMRATIMLGTNDPLSLWKDLPHAHIGLMSSHLNQVSVAVRIFRTTSAVVMVSADQTRYPGLFSANSVGRFIEIDPKQRKLRQSSLWDEVSRMAAQARSA